VHLLRVAFTKIAAEHANLFPENVLALAVRSVNSMTTSTGLSRLEIDCGRPARHPPLSEEQFALSPPVLPASAHEIEEFMNAAAEN
jgi:phosphatidate phosphatase APP1